MSVRRLLVEAAVLSVQDSYVYYPCCKCCFSRIDVEQEDATRCRCFKCGYRCVKEQLDYRYRLSLKATRDKRIFGVTVFGSCLNPFFGVHAGGLQRLVDNVDGPVGASTRSTFLVQAVEDCFIGRRFIFGIKVTGTESDLWSRWPVANGSSSRNTVQLVASEMILPKATERSGCTVLSYYRALLQRAEEYEQRPADTDASSRPPANAVLLIPLRSPATAFNNTTLCVSALLSPSLLSCRAQHQDCSVNPTPPWQQSLGLVTSSAEQDESVVAQERGDEIGCSKTRSCAADGRLREEATVSPLSHNSSFFSIYSDFSAEKSVNTPTQDPSFKKGFPRTQLSATSSSPSLVWDDLPFSESLTEFLNNKDNVPQTELCRNVQNAAETTRHLENVSHDKVTVSQSHLPANITPAPNKRRASRDSSDAGCEKLSSEATSIRPSVCYQCDVGLGPLSPEEQLEGTTYNCSADLFSDSLDTDTTTSCLHTNRGGSTNLDKRTQRSELPHGLYLTSHTGKRRTSQLDSPAPRFLDFFPPSQSTPTVEVTRVPKLAACRRFSPALRLQLDSQDPCPHDGNLKNASSPWKLNAIRADPPSPCDYKRKSSICDVTVRHHEDDEVPPTPAVQTQPSVKRQRYERGSNVNSTCKSTTLTPSLTFSQRSTAQSGNSDREGGPDGCLLDDENQACDWSRDLFSDF